MYELGKYVQPKVDAAGLEQTDLHIHYTVRQGVWVRGLPLETNKQSSTRQSMYTVLV